MKKNTWIFPEIKVANLQEYNSNLGNEKPSNILWNLKNYENKLYENMLLKKNAQLFCDIKFTI